MRVFVTGTGRCGTCTFYNAVKHCTNYTTGHESLAGNVVRHEYPDCHIEVSSQLIIGIPYLRKMYPEAKWIVLTRNQEACAKSIIEAVPASLVCWNTLWHQAARIENAELMVAHLNELCRYMLPDAYLLQMEQASTQWADLWSYLGLQGDYERSVAEWSRKYNRHGNRGRDCF